MISRSFLLKLDKAWFLQMQCFFLLLSFISSYYSCFLFISFTFSIYIVFYICFFFFSHFPFLLVHTFPLFHHCCKHDGKRRPLKPSHSIATPGAQDTWGEMGGVMAQEAPQHAPVGFQAHHRGMHIGS